MPSFFSVRLAPGIRVSASTRGLRAHVGPRGARVHVGGGRTGVSTGAGPFTYYTSGTTAGRRPARRSYDTGPTAAQLNRADKEQQARLITEKLDAVHRLHHAIFPPLERRVAGLPPLPPFPELVRTEEKSALAGLGLFARSARREARSTARAAAESRARTLLADAQLAQQHEQQRLDATWASIVANDETAVLPLLEAAFADNEAPVAAVGTSGRDVSIAVLVPGLDVLPDRAPSTTAAGNLSLRKASKGQRAEWHRQLVAGHVLVSVKETLAMAPGAATVTVVAVCREGGKGRPLLATRLRRVDLSSEQWTSDAWAILERTGLDTRVAMKGTARELRPIDLSSEPDLQRLADLIELDESS